MIPKKRRGPQTEAGEAEYQAKLDKFIQRRPTLAKGVLFFTAVALTLGTQGEIRRGILTILIPLGYPKEWIF